MYVLMYVIMYVTLSMYICIYVRLLEIFIQYLYLSASARARHRIPCQYECCVQEAVADADQECSHVVRRS